MKCYYQVGDGPWIKGEATSLSGGRMLYFSSPGQPEIGLADPEILFHSSGFSATGYQRQPGDNLFRLVSVDVRTVKPKEKS